MAQFSWHYLSIFPSQSHHCVLCFIITFAFLWYLVTHVELHSSPGAYGTSTLVRYTEHSSYLWKQVVLSGFLWKQEWPCEHFVQFEWLRERSECVKKKMLASGWMDFCCVPHDMSPSCFGERENCCCGIRSGIGARVSSRHIPSTLWVGGSACLPLWHHRMWYLSGRHHLHHSLS